MGMGSEDLHGRRCYKENLGWPENNYPEKEFKFPIKDFSCLYSYDSERFLSIIKVGHKIDVISSYTE